MDEYAEFQIIENADETPDSELATAVAKLRPDYRKLIDKFYTQGMSYQQIGKELGIPWGQVQKRLWKARLQIKKNLASAVRVDSAFIESAQGKEAQADRVDTIMGGDDSGTFKARKPARHAPSPR
jgi:uncharacterized protein YjcR